LSFILLLKRINPEKLIDVQKKLESFLAQDQDLKERAQRVSLN
jgi:ATP-dependent RNA helicase DDX10/DBP4